MKPKQLSSKTAILTLAYLLVLSACATQTKLQKQTVSADAVVPLSQLQEQIDAILQDSSLAQTSTGIKVMSLETGEVLYERNSRQLFHPASNMKLLTTAVALSKLGPSFRYKTVLYTDTSAVSDSAISDSTLWGNLYLKGFGNPDMTSADLRWIVDELKRKGFKTITGNLVCDETYFDDLYWGNGWMWDDVSAWYWAPIGALTVNDNCVSVFVKPGKNLGDSLVVQMEPATSYMKIENFGITVDSTDSTRLKEFEVERKWRPAENTVVIKGGMARQSEEQEFVIDVVEPALYTGTLFSELLAEEGMQFLGQVTKDTLPDSAVMLVKHLSHPLSEVVLNTNKVSDNLSAELLLKTVGAELFGPPGTADKGIIALHRFFHEIGVDTTTFRVVDGSGVSRYDLVYPAQVVELLKAMNADFRVQAEYKTSLPIAGVDGTLSSRMEHTAAERKLRAKTGSLSGVSSLAGYTTTADGELLAFSMIMEHFLVTTSKIRNVQDRIGALLSEVSRKALATQ